MHRIVVALSILTLAGCSAGEVATIENLQDGTSVISKTAANKGMVVHKIGKDIVVCDSLSSDATSNTTFSLVDSSKDQAQDGVTEGELTGRSPQLLALRDSMYSACLMYVSGALTKSQYSSLASKLLLTYADSFSSFKPSAYELKIHQNVVQPTAGASLGDGNNEDGNNEDGNNEDG